GHAGLAQPVQGAQARVPQLEVGPGRPAERGGTGEGGAAGARPRHRRALHDRDAQAPAGEGPGGGGADDARAHDGYSTHVSRPSCPPAGAAPAGGAPGPPHSTGPLGNSASTTWQRVGTGQPIRSPPVRFTRTEASSGRAPSRRMRTAPARAVALAWHTATPS